MNELQRAMRLMQKHGYSKEFLEAVLRLVQK